MDLIFGTKYFYFEFDIDLLHFIWYNETEKECESDE